MNILPIIRNAKKPICCLCKYIIMDIQYPKEYNMARCMKSGEQCRISGEIKYDYADYSRRNFILCGDEGKFYERKAV